jgi:hypothetical protein
VSSRASPRLINGSSSTTNTDTASPNESKAPPEPTANTNG